MSTPAREIIAAKPRLVRGEVMGMTVVLHCGHSVWLAGETRSQQHLLGLWLECPCGPCYRPEVAFA